MIFRFIFTLVQLFILRGKVSTTLMKVGGVTF